MYRVISCAFDVEVQTTALVHVLMLCTCPHHRSRDGKTMALGSMATSKDQDQQYVYSVPSGCRFIGCLCGYVVCWLFRRHKSIASSRPSTVMRQEREAMQAKVDRLKGQLKEMKRWRSHQSLARRNLLQAKASPEMTTHRSFEHLPTVHTYICAYMYL